MITYIYFNHLDGDEDTLLAANEEQKEECITMLNTMGLEITHICEDEPDMVAFCAESNGNAMSRYY